MIQMGTPMAHNISFHPSKKAGEAADVGADTADAEGWAWGGLGKVRWGGTGGGAGRLGGGLHAAAAGCHI